MDDAIGDVINLYKKYGYWENTIVIFSSDNGGKNVGGGYNYPLRGEKGGLYEGLLGSTVDRSASSDSNSNRLGCQANSH